MNNDITHSGNLHFYFPLKRHFYFIIYNRKDLSPNVCAVYTEENHRGQGIAGRLLDLVVDDMRKKGISPLYLVTDHTGFYERYGWEFYCMAQGDDEPEQTRLYIHR